jgi:hypothetical protein
MDTQQIKDHMPETYKAIQEKAGKIGNEAYRLVRSGLAGKPNKFYAIERGYVAGTPFDMGNVPEELARLALQFGISFLIMWAPEAQQLEQQAQQGGSDGAR